MKENNDLIKESNQNKVEKTVTFNLIEIIIIILMTGLVVGVSTGIVVYRNYNNNEKNIPGHKTDYLSEFESAYYNILNSYVEKVNEKELMNAAIEGMYNFLGDPYTSYLDETMSDDLTDRLNGYKGIGVEITKIEQGILVANVFENGPADIAGLEIGDIIVKINGKDVTKSTAAEAQNMIKKSADSKIEMSVLRGGITITLEIDVKEVHVPTIEKSIYEGVGYIRITSFSNKTSEQFETALKELEEQNITSLVIDLRNNGGGYLNAAYEIAELFVEKGKNIYGLETKKGTTFYEDRTKASRNYKVGILMNGGSASASEILAAALKESYGATLIGTLSYGKGTVQETSELSTGGMIKYTTAYWLTPDGNKIDGKGLKPDVEINGAFRDGLPYEEDVQLKEAINTVK